MDSGSFSQTDLKKLVLLLEFPFQTIQEMLDKSLETILDISLSRYGYIYFYRQASREFELFSWSKDVMNDCRVTHPQTRYKLEETGLWGEVVRQGKALIVNDFEAHNPLKRGFPTGHVMFHNFASFPLIRNKEVVAVVGMADRPTAYDMELLYRLELFFHGIWSKLDSLMQKSLEEDQSAIQAKINLEIVSARQHLQRLLDTLQEAYVVVDMDARIVEWNQAFLDHLRIDAETAARFTIRDFNAQLNQAELVDLIARLSNTNGSFETLHRRSDRVIVPVEIRAAAFVEDGHTFLLSVIREVVDRAEDRRLINLLHQGISGLAGDLEAGVFQVDQMARRSRILADSSQTWYRLSHDSYRPQLQDLDLKELLTEVCQSLRYPGPDPDGSREFVQEPRIEADRCLATLALQNLIGAMEPWPLDQGAGRPVWSLEKTGLRLQTPGLQAPGPGLRETHLALCRELMVRQGGGLEQAKAGLGGWSARLWWPG